MIGLISGTVTAAARTMGHWISFCITLTLMLALFIFILRQAAWGHRSYKPRFHRWGPIVLLGFAIPLIMADLIRHLIQDAGGWAECGNNDVYPRINATDPYPDSCAWASNQYKCTKLCCVPTWNPANTTAGGEWWSPQTTYFPPTKWDKGAIVKSDDDAAFPDQFAVQLQPSGELQFPDGFDKTKQPWRVFQTPLVLDGTGTVNIAGPAQDDGKPLYPRGDCKPEYSPKGAAVRDGVNPETGYCFLTDQNLPYAEQLKQLDDSSCDCDACLPISQETMAHLSNVGIVFTIVLTYTGFALLATAVMWNAEIVTKFKKIGQQWRELRAEQRRRKLEAASAMGA